MTKTANKIAWAGSKDPYEYIENIQIPGKIKQKKKKGF